MSALEDRLRDAMAASGRLPAPDLFERVLDGAAADAARRRHRRRVFVARALAVSGSVLGVVLLTVLELAMNAVLVAVALWLGPFIKRFGRAYAADVFHIFAAYILFTVSLEPLDQGAPPW